MILRIRHGGTEQRIGPAGVATRLPTGEVIRARPRGDQDAIAAAHGYPDAAALTADHDPAHAWLAAALDMPASPALQAAAGLEHDARLAMLEEAAVMALQAYARAAVRAPWRTST